WPVTSIVLGAVTYSKSETIAILDLNVKKDASLALADQLIAAKLNIASGSNPTPIAPTITRADNLLAAFPGKLPYNVPPNSSTGNMMTSTATTLEDYNAGRLPNSCGTGNTAPLANAGPDQTVSLGSIVTLNGSASSDADGNPLTFSWSFVSKPASSAAVLSDFGAVMPAFPAEAPGAYDLQVIVNDGTANSAADTVRVSTQNSRPIASAGPDQTLVVGSLAQLDGSSSSDPDGD